MRNFQRSKSIKRIFLQSFWLIVSWFFFTTYFPWPSKLKGFILKLFGASVGERIIIRPNVYIKLPWNLSLGNDVWLGYDVMIDNEEPVIIGNSVCISQRVSIFTGSHDFNDPSFAYFGREVHIKDNCWVAACALLLPGASIETGTFIKAGTIKK